MVSYCDPRMSGASRPSSTVASKDVSSLTTGWIWTKLVGVCICSMFCCTLIYAHSSIAVILMGKKELIALLNLSSCCLVMVEWLFLAVPWGCLRFAIVVLSETTRHSALIFGI